jgi:hypothetical protein
MTVEECVGSWIIMPAEDRAIYGPSLIRMLSPLSINTLLEFQRNWDDTKPYEEFVAAQSAELIRFAQLEASEMGATVRAEVMDNPPPFAMDTEVLPFKPAPVMERSESMQDTIDAKSKEIFGRTLSEAHAAKICVDCAAKADDDSFDDEVSKAEYGISGFCQKCQDRIFVEPEEDEDEGGAEEPPF